MRSIRLSLMVYFLGLLCLALTVASALLYETARITLSAKEQASVALIEARHDERAREARQRLDERLLMQAKTLAGRVRPRFRWDRVRDGQFQSAALSGLVAAPSMPGAALNSLFYGAYGLPYRNRKGWPPMAHPVQSQLWRHELVELEFGKDVALPDEPGWPRIGYRIETNNWGLPLHPPTPQPLELPPESDFAPDERLTWVLDDYRLPSGVPVRRVRFRALITLQDASPPPGPPVTSGRSGYRPPPASIIIQCAADTRELDAQLDELAAQRDAELTALRDETDLALHSHRRRLLWISGLTFAATALGSLLLIWTGLAPLARLSEAVSTVSPRNFRLGISADSLPRELRPIAARLDTTLDLLRRAFAREKQATADISHELRTPLAALLTTIDLALRKPRTVEQYREFLGDCRLSASQMHQIVERLLTLARLDAGVDRLRAQPVDVAALAEQCATVVRPLAEARGLRLSVVNRCEEAEAARQSDGPLLTDADKLREVLTNLLHNAVQYNRPQGRIDLTVARQNGHVRLEVSDTGIGIAPEAREHIFERFYRADPSRNADDLHAGLGLAIVKAYVELMGGRIAGESVEGQGSTFRIDLPMHGPAQAG